jgi:class 3 adenylate cyclase
MICTHCRTENPATARFCLNCGQAMVQHCPSCQALVPPDARFCTNCGQPATAATPADHARLSQLAAAAPRPLADKVRAAAHLAGERRVVTILFADVVGSTALAEELGAETWMAVMNDAFDRIIPAVYRYEGTVARLVGDGLWAFFGAPVAHEDDPARAVRAALDLLDAAGEVAEEVWRAHGIRFAMRACLNTGAVVVGDVGDDLTYEYTAMGGAVNLAARLKFATEPMTLLITENTHRFVAPILDCADLGPIDIKGRVEPIRLYVVHGLKGEPGHVRGLAGLQSPMVGRDAELATLEQACEAVRAGLGRAVLIVGEPGLGKTRLIAEWKMTVTERMHDPPPLWAEGHGLSYGHGLAYHLLIDLLRSIVGIPEGADEPEARAALRAYSANLFADSTLDVYPHLGHLLSLKLEDEALEQIQLLDPQALQAQYLAAVRSLLLAIASRRPLVLILEDLHWADPSSTELLVKLLPLASTAPMLFCMVTRPERDAPGWKLVTTARETLDRSLTEFTLRALSEDDSRQLVSNLLSIEALPDRLRGLILKKAEGNPFFVEEVIRMLIDRGAIIRRDGKWHAEAEIEDLDIPDNLQGLLLARIDRLSDEAKRTLRVASVIGRQFPVKVLEHVLERGLTE